MASQIILAFDTSSSACSVALEVEGRVSSTHLLAPLQQAKLILPMIQELLEAQALQLEQVDVIAYGCGPGSFTGSRIASSVAQGLGFASKRPLLPISSLAALAQTAYKAHNWSRLIVAVDARVQEIYGGFYQKGPGDCVELIREEWIGKPGELSLNVDKSAGWYGVGDGWEVYGDILSDRFGIKPIEINTKQALTAEAVLELAKTALGKGQTCISSPAEALPVYLR